MYFAGIDIAKREHWMAVIDSDGAVVIGPRPYPNDSDGLARMASDLDSLGAEVSVGMESTGCYWRACWASLCGAGYRASVMNPVVTCAHRKSRNLGRAKSDWVDCLVIADTVRTDRPAPLSAPDGSLADLRELSRFQRSVSEAVADAKIRALAVIDQVWPEHSDVFRDSFAPSAMAAVRWLLGGSGDVDLLLESVASASKGRCRPGLASEVASSLAASCGVPLSLGLRMELSLLLDRLDFLNGQLSEVDSALEALLSEVAPQVLTVPGIGTRTGAQIVAEVGDVSRFPDAGALCAYAGLDPSVCQSGGYESDQAHISKKGSAYLRRSLYLAASANLRTDSAFRECYDRFRTRGKSHRSAVCAVARKMCCVVWALMRTGEEYDPEKHRGKG